MTYCSANYFFSTFVGHQLSGLGEHHVLHPRCSYLLGLDILCRSNCGTDSLLVTVMLFYQKYFKL